MKNIFLKYGIAGGLFSSILGTLNWILIAKTVGVSASQAVGYTSITLSLLCVPFGIRYFRDKHNQGTVTFEQALKVGVGITSIAAVVMAVHSILFFVFQKEEFLEWQRKNLNPAELVAFNEQLSQAPDFVYSPWFQGIVMFFMVFLIGTVVNVVSALVMKRETKP